MSESEQMAYLTERAARGNPTRMAEILAKPGTTNEILPGDELPEGYFDGC